MVKVRIGKTEFYLWRKVKIENGQEVVKVNGAMQPVNRSEDGKPYIEWGEDKLPEGAQTDKIIVM